MLRKAVAVLIGLLALVGLATAIVAVSFARRGISAREAPGRAETVIARRLRSAAIPRTARDRQNPVAASAEALKEGMEHFADHCAVCHANDGSGSPMGKSLYPPAPDMRAASTQQLSDGELFAIIENGIRLTGMPAWGNGTPEGEASSWALVHFIRRLPRLPPEDVARMEALNPRSPDEFREQEEERRFLAGETGAASPAPAPEKRTHHH